MDKYRHRFTEKNWNNLKKMGSLVNPAIQSRVTFQGIESETNEFLVDQPMQFCKTLSCQKEQIFGRQIYEKVPI